MGRQIDEIEMNCREKCVRSRAVSKEQKYWYRKGNKEDNLKSLPFAVEVCKAVSKCFLPIVILDELCGSRNGHSFVRVVFRQSESISLVQFSVVPMTSHTYRAVS